jgi:hypothetical protein
MPAVKRPQPRPASRPTAALASRCVLCAGDDQLWQDVHVAARALGADPLLVAREFWRWFVGRPGSRLPERPPAVAGGTAIHQPPLANPQRTKVTSLPPG